MMSRPEARDALARTVVAEAGDQGDSGMAGVVYAILNRLSDGRWGETVEAVVDAPGQFEPVMRVGGSWRNLKPATTTQQAHVDAIVNLALDGRLPDLTHGARYFQNPQVVSARARRRTVSAALVNFGGITPSAVIGAHAFYTELGTNAKSTRSASRATRGGGASSEIFVGGNKAGSLSQAAAGGEPVADPNRARNDEGDIFVR